MSMSIDDENYTFFKSGNKEKIKNFLFTSLKILPVLVLIAAMVGAALNLRNNQDPRSSAVDTNNKINNTDNSDTSQTSPPLPTLPFQMDTILGQPDDKETMTNRIVANRGFHLGGVHIDSQNRIYVFDSGNNRILGFNSYTGPNQNADIVIGQGQLTDRGTANGNDTDYTQPSSNTIATQPYPNVISTLESARLTQMATDQEDNLYTVDLENNRILFYRSPFTTDAIADDVWGQPDMNSRNPSCGQSGFPVSSSAFCFSDDGIFGQPAGIHITFMAGVTIDPSGNLWVTDTSNNRVLRFPKVNSTISKTADLVLGQSDFTSRNPAYPYTKSLAQMQKPLALKFKPQTGELYVVEGEWAGEARILVFTPPFTNGMQATREIGRAVYQDTQPTNSTNWENISGKWVNLTSGLYWPRGIAFDPSETGDIFAQDNGNNRTVLFASDGAIIDVIGQSNSNSRGCLGRADQGFIQFDGNKANLCQSDGGIGVDSTGNIYLSTIGNADEKDIVRFSTPLTKNPSGLVISNGSLLHKGSNQYSGKTFMNGYGMSKSSGTSSQLYVSDRQRLLVWNNPSSLSTFAQANYVVGQDDFESNMNNNGGIFNAIGLGAQTVDPAGKLYLASNNRIYIFNIPFTSGGKNYPVNKMLYSNWQNSSQNIVWADDGLPVTFNPAGLAFDSLTGALFISDPERHRILRVSNPLSAATVDLVIGQPDKSSSAQNLGSPNPVRNGLAFPTNLSIDKFGNLYVVDASYELNGNRRLLRFNAAKITPQSGNIFPLPDADAVFSKSSFTSRNLEPNQPGSPTAVGFDAANRMVLLSDGYGNKFDERVYFYSTPQLGEVIYPDSLIKIPMAQGSSVLFSDEGKLILQDHTWNRILFTSLSLLPVSTPTPTPTFGKLPTPTPTTYIPTKTPTITPALLTLGPVADSYVNSNYPNNNSGKEADLKVKSSPAKIAYLKFDLAPLALYKFNTARFKFWINDPTNGTLNLYLVPDNSWTETGITYNNKPALGNLILSFTANASGVYKEIDITNFMKSNSSKIISFAFQTTSTNELSFKSRNIADSSRRPILIFQ